jgi:hypothetical protein
MYSAQWPDNMSMWVHNTGLLGSILILIFLATCNYLITLSSDSTVLLTVSPMPLSEDREYSVPREDNFTVTCTAASRDPNVFVLWRRTDGKQDNCSFAE